MVSYLRRWRVCLGGRPGASLFAGKYLACGADICSPMWISISIAYDTEGIRRHPYSGIHTAENHIEFIQCQPRNVVTPAPRKLTSSREPTHRSTLQRYLRPTISRPYNTYLRTHPTLRIADSIFGVPISGHSLIFSKMEMLDLLLEGDFATPDWYAEIWRVLNNKICTYCPRKLYFFQMIWRRGPEFSSRIFCRMLPFCTSVFGSPTDSLHFDFQ